MAGTMGVPSGVLIFTGITTAALILCWIETVRVLRREQRRAEELAEEIVMLREEFGPDRALSRLNDYRGPFWMVVNEVLANPALGSAPSKTYDELGRRQAQIAGGPPEVFLGITVLVACSAGFVGTCGMCLWLLVPDLSDPSEPGMHQTLVPTGILLLAPGILGLLALSAMRSHRACLARCFAVLLQKIADAFRARDPDAAEPDQPKELE